jgi:DNA-binding XRE family transcriptional regulator
MHNNYLREIRESLMISKTELARKAHMSTITIARIEKGKPCRTETKRKLVLALGLKISDKNRVFGEATELSIKDKGDRRSGVDQRKFSYAVHIPEHRSGNERRNGLDRRLKSRTSK